MEIARRHLSLSEKERRRSQGLCLSACSSLTEGATVSRILPVPSKPLVKIRIRSGAQDFLLAAFVDSGADAEFMDLDLACQLSLEMEPLPETLQWYHSSTFFCHPGAPRTSAVLLKRFWWLSVRRDTVSQPLEHFRSHDVRFRVSAPCFALPVPRTFTLTQ
ncbi:hypothetical protein HF521_013575 [Silurus meridionalis]|uniref:Uncharacterized protein n=1 Tax=Silurus meridionalis TaxID=175797 RepID=A0A8T0AA41_SILME|nr:hypothetical protein HF521_013575 [Silurus meridionalis]